MSESLPPAEPSDPQSPALANQAIDRVRHQPAKAVGTAFITGLILSVFPVGKILSAFVGLALSLVRPALLVFGAFKVWEEVERRRK